MNEQVSGEKPWDRWFWVAGILVVLFFVLLWGMQTAIQEEEAPPPGDVASYDDSSAPADSGVSDAAPADAGASDAPAAHAAPAAPASGS